jgi:glycosyltransferase involved in cell wall biosynthesis
VHVAIDLRIADAPGMEMTGSGRYAIEATRSLQRARPSWVFSIHSNRRDLRWPAGDTRVISTRVPTDHAIGRIAWLHVASAIPTRRSRPDVWFSPSFVLPLWWRGNAVVTIHDLTFLLLRDRYRGRVNAWYATVATRSSARRADRVLCGSGATRQLLVDYFGVPAATIEVIPYGVAEAFFEQGAEENSSGRALAETPYILFVGTWEARKGIATLHTALNRVNDEETRVRLVLAGQPGWGTERLLDAMRRNPAVEFRRGPSDDELASLYRGALALTYPSEMEGFGLPVAEAMACGCPVIASDLPSIREFAGEVPHYIRSGDSDGLADHVEQLLDGDQDAAQRARRGREAVAPLRWSTLGERTATVIEQLTA